MLVLQSAIRGCNSFHWSVLPLREKNRQSKNRGGGKDLKLCCGSLWEGPHFLPVSPTLTWEAMEISVVCFMYYFLPPKFKQRYVNIIIWVSAKTLKMPKKYLKHSFRSEFRIVMMFRAKVLNLKIIVSYRQNLSLN